MKKSKSISVNWYQIKRIAAFSMVLDHMVASGLVTQTFLMTYLHIDLKISAVCVEIMRFFGRVAFPIYAYSIAQGCVYTQSFFKYLIRLSLFAIVSEIPFNLALNDGVLLFAFNNIGFTLLFGALACTIYQYLKSKSKVIVSIFPILLLTILAELLHMDYGGMGVLCIIITYSSFQVKKIRLMALSSALAILYLLIVPFNGVMDMRYIFQWMIPGSSIFTYLAELIGSYFGVLLLALFDEESGNQAKGRLKAYLFYPAHLIVIFFCKLFV